MKTGFYYNKAHSGHDTGPEHPESPWRVEAIKNSIIQSDLITDLFEIEGRAVDSQYLSLAHSDLYLQQIKQIAPTIGRVWADKDTPMVPGSLDAAELAAGSAIQATQEVLAGRLKNAFCCVRPPGHHAEPRKTMGFCFYNNVVLAAKYALEIGKLSRVAIIDFDVHQGNGTIESCLDDDRILVCTSFQHPFFPNSHWRDIYKNVINTPIAEGTGGTEYRRIIEKDWLQKLEGFKPEMIFISAGFDAHELDVMGGLRLQNEDFRWITNMICSIAKLYSKNRVVSVLEGGYNLKALAGSARAHMEELHNS
jgi:acetoin utilization deacetylase AcuC-like enzyme